MQLWIGTSGYSYPDWVGTFYPAGTRGPRMLDHYARQFPLVELNFTFYRLPTPDMLARLADRVPAGFQFLVKLPRTISHDQSSKDIAPFHEAVLELERRKCLLGLLCQLPQSVHQTKAAWHWLERITGEYGGLGLAVEFRHRSWTTPEVQERLREEKVDLVSVDVPKLPDLYPTGLVQSTDRAYIRLHSRRTENWYLSDKDRYDYDYSDGELREWLSALAARTDRLARVMILFNNCHRAQAAANTRRMQELVREFDHPFELITPALPLGEAPPTQKLLFE